MIRIRMRISTTEIELCGVNIFDSETRLKLLEFPLRSSDSDFEKFSLRDSDSDTYSESVLGWKPDSDSENFLCVLTMSRESEPIK